MVVAQAAQAQNENTIDRAAKYDLRYKTFGDFVWEIHFGPQNAKIKL